MWYNYNEVILLAIKILIGGVDYTNGVGYRVLLDSLRISSNIAVSNDTASFDVVITNRSIPMPLGGKEIKIMNGNTIEFGGVVINPREVALSTDTMLYNVTCKDYIFWLDKRVVTDTYNNYTAGNIVKAIVNNYSSGFTTNNVHGTEASFAISQMKFDHVPPSKAIKKLADSTNFQFWIDYNRDVHFSFKTTNPSPLPNNTFYPDTDLTYSNLVIEEDITQIRNQVYLLGFKVPQKYTYTEAFTCDGQTLSFNTTYEPVHYTKKITVKLNDVVKDVDYDIAGGLPSEQMSNNKVYVNFAQARFRFNVAPIGTLQITYYPMVEIVKMYNSPESMQLMKERDLQDGVYELGIRDKQLSSFDAGRADIRGQLELYKYGFPHYSGTFTSFTQGWQPGQYFYITSNSRMDGMFQNKQFFVIKVDKEIVSHAEGGDPIFRYSVGISDTPYTY